MAYKQGNRWVVKWRDPYNRQLTKRFRTKTEASIWEGEIARKRITGTELPSKAPTLAAFVEHEYQPKFAHVQLASSTWATYMGNLRQRILPVFGPVRLDRITRRMIDHAVADWHHAGTGARTIQSSVTTLSSVLERGVEWGYLPANPAHKVRTPRVTSRKPSIPTLAQVEALAAHAPTIRDFAIVTVAASTGMRQGELFRLTWADVDLDEARAHVKESKTYQERYVPLDEAAVAALRTWQPHASRKTPLVFHTTARSKMHPSNWNRRVWHGTEEEPGMTRKSGLDGFRFHDLRHVAASRWINDGVPPAKVAGWLGHSLETLFRVYAHILPE